MSSIYAWIWNRNTLKVSHSETQANGLLLSHGCPNVKHLMFPLPRNNYIWEKEWGFNYCVCYIKNWNSFEQHHHWKDFHKNYLEWDETFVVPDVRWIRIFKRCQDKIQYMQNRFGLHVGHTLYAHWFSANRHTHPHFRCVLIGLTFQDFCLKIQIHLWPITFCGR